MSTESLTNSASHASSSASHTKPSEQSQLSDSTQNDLNTSSSQSKKQKAKTNNLMQQHTAASTTVATAASPQPSSPTKITPIKSRNKRRNEARKRSANTKKQQSIPTIIDGKESLSQQVEHQQAEDAVAGINITNKPSETRMSKNDENELNKTYSETTHEQDSSHAPSSHAKDPLQDFTEGNKVEVSVDDQEKRSQAEKSLPSSNGNHSEPKAETANPPASNAPHNINNHDRQSHDTNSWRRKQRENKELKDQIKIRDSQIQILVEKLKQQIDKVKKLEASLVSTTRTCSQFEKLLQQELISRSRLEAEIDNLSSIIMRLKNQISSHEKDKNSNSELIRVLNATLMERETEVSILKLKMTRLQTNTSINLNTNRNSNVSLAKPDPCKSYTMAGRSNSEFSRNSYSRSTMMAEAINARSSTSRLQNEDRDASIWANVPEELTPSKRPLLLEKSLPVYDHYQNINDDNQSSTPLTRDRRYRTLPKSMKSPPQAEVRVDSKSKQSTGLPSQDPNQPAQCLITNLDESNTSRSSGNRSSETPSRTEPEPKPVPNFLTDDTKPYSVPPATKDINQACNNSPTCSKKNQSGVYSSIGNMKSNFGAESSRGSIEITKPPALPLRSPSTPVKKPSGLMKILGKFKRSDSSVESKSKTDLPIPPPPPITPTTSSFKRDSIRSTMITSPSHISAHISPRKAIEFQTDKPFAEWDTNMLVDWLTMIGLSMYSNQCRRWVKCGAHIMNATPAEVDKGLGITNHLHRKKLRLAISELNGDCDKITKAAAKLDYLWVARWLDDIGLPQYKEAFINARVDGRVLNYLTIEDLVSLGVRSVLHHSSIRCGIRVLRSINFDIHLLKRRATAEEIEQMSSVRQYIEDQAGINIGDKTDGQQIGAYENDIPLWTCHRLMEWLRMIDFAEFATNLRGSGVHGGLIIYEDAFNIDTMSTLLSIPTSRTLLRRHLSTFFQILIGADLALRKRQHKELSSSQQLNPTAEIKTPKKSPLWFGKLKSSKVGQDGMDEYLCPMYPVEPQIVKSPVKKPELNKRDASNLPRIPESVNV